MSAILGPLTGLGSVTANLGYILPTLIAAIAYFQLDMMDPESRPIDMETELLNEAYDFIIIGAGSAGRSSVLPKVTQ